MALYTFNGLAFMQGMIGVVNRGMVQGF